VSFNTKELRSYHAWEERGPNQDLELLRKAADHIDAQAAEIERLKKALRVAVLALAHATEEHGKVYEPAYDAVQIALYGDPDAT